MTGGAGGLGGRATGGSGTGGIPSGGGSPGNGGTTGHGGSGGNGGTYSRDAGPDAIGADAAGGSGGSPLLGVIGAFCTTARTCCSQAGFSLDSLSDCEAKFATRTTQAQLIDLGQATINTVALAACEAAYKEAATTCTTKDVVTACQGILVGVQDENQPCGKGGNPSVTGVPACKKSGGPEICQWTASDLTDPTVAGICKKMVHGKQGDPCVFSCGAGDDCSNDEIANPTDTNVTWCFDDDGLYCSTLISPATCAPIVALGASCQSDPDSCGSANFCDRQTAICKADSTLGQSCSQSPCVSPLVCGSDLNCAQAAIPFANQYGSCQGYAPEFL